MNTRKLFLTSLLAAATMSVPAFGAGSADTILINFTGGRSNVEPVAVTNDTVNGTWNNEANASQSRPQTLLFSNNTESSATITWSSANTYTTGLSETYEVLTGYLDDGSGVSISVSDVSYLLYDVTIIAATDTAGVKFSYKTVNGVAYTSDGNGGAVFGSSAWGASRQLTVGNNNSFTISGLTGDLSISSVASGTARGCIAGIQIVNTYAGTAHAATLDADSAWTTTLLGSAPWTNSTAEAGTYADVTLSADVNLSASAGIVTDGIVVSGGHTLTLSAAEGNTAGIDLIGPGVVRVADGSTLSLSNGTILNFKGSNSSISGAISGTGSLVAKSGSSLNLAGATLTGFTGTLSAESGAAVYLGNGLAGLNWTSKTYALDFASDATLKLGLTANIANSVKLGQADFAGRVNVFAGQFTINESDIGNGTWVLEDGVILRQFGTTVAGSTTYDPTTKITTINNDMIVNSGTVEFRVNAGAEGGSSHGSKLIYAGDISGSGTLKKANGGVVDFTGNINLGGFTNASGTTNITGSATLGALNVSGGMLILGGASTSFTSANVSSSGTLKFDIGTDATMKLDHTLTNNGSLFIDSGTLVLSHGDLYGSTTVATGAVLDLTGNTRSADSSGSGNLYISGGIVKIANLGWGAGANFGANFNYDRVQLSNGGVLDVTSAQPNGTGAGERGFSVIAERGTYRFSGTGSSYSVNGRAEQLISIADGAELVFDVVEASASLTVSKLIARGTDPANGTSERSTGSVTKKGEGTLMLSHANNYSGGTTIERGTLVAANASALGAGNVTVADGATLERGLASGSVAIGGTLTTNGAAILSTGALSVDTAAFAAQGNVTLSAGTIFDVASLVEDGKVVSSAGTLTVADSGTFTKDNFLLNGSVLGGRTEFEVSTDGKSVTISNLTQNALELTWAGGDSDTWKANGSGWNVKASDDAETFQAGDSVIFSDGSSLKNVVVDGAVSVGTMTIDSNADFDFSGQNSAAIGSSGALTKTGTGTATIASTVDLSRIGGGIVVNGGKLVVDTASGYTGVATAGANGTFTLNVSSDTTLSNTLSGEGTFEKTGAGTLTVSSGVSAAELTFAVAKGGAAITDGTNTLKALTVSGEGSTLNISGGTTTTANGTTVGNGAELVLGASDAASHLQGVLTINNGGTVKLTGGDATGYGNAEGTDATNVIYKLVINKGGVLEIGTDATQSGQNQTFNMKDGVVLLGGQITAKNGVSNAKFDLFNKNTTTAGVTTLGSDTTAVISADIGLRNKGSFNVASGTTADGVDLLVSGRLTNYSAVTGGNPFPAALTKSGAGTMKLTGDNQYWTTGGTIEEGTLIAAHANALGKGGTIRVLENATLGFVAETTVDMLKTTTTNDGTTTTNGAIQLTSGAKIVVDMLGQDANQEKIVLDLVSGVALSYGGVDVTADNVDTLLNPVISLKNWGDGWTQSLSYANDTLSLTLTIPEPSVFGLLAGLGALALAGTRRRRKKA